MARLEATIAALAIGVTAAFSGAAAAENVLRWASAGGALTIDPHAYEEAPTHAQLTQVYEKLLDFDSNLDIVPMLAVAWRLVEPTIWEFDLRPNVRFHDGAPFTAADVVFSIARAKTEFISGFSRHVEGIDEVQAIDQHTVRIHTKFPDPQLWDKVHHVYIMSESWAEAHDARVPVNVSAGEENYASRHANGTGPFILKAFEQNGPVVMVRNPDWWGLERYPHNIDRIEYTPIADPEKRLQALLRGDLDLLTDPPLAALDRLEGTPGLKLAQAPELRTISLGVDQGSAELRSSDVKGKNPFKDRRVRRAIYQAIDIEAIRRDIMRGLALPAGMLVPPGVIGYAPELDQRLPYDPETAKGLLAEAGYPGGFSVTLDCPNDRWINDEAICRAIAAQLGEVGINVTANPQPKQLFFAKIDNRETDFFFDSWGAIDSEVIFKQFYRTGTSDAGYSNPHVDELIDQIDRTMITYGRDALIEEVWRTVLDEIVYIPLYHQVIVWAMRDDLELPVYPFNRPLLWEARFE